MKTALLVSMVVGAHVIVIGGIMLTQGCGVSPRAQLDPGMPGEPNMPPTVTTVDTVVIAPPVSPIVTPKTVIDLPEETSTYVVGKGESLSVIAREHGLSVADIVALNSIKDPNKVRAGQKLLLPGKDTAGMTKKVSSAPAVSTSKTVDIPEGTATYTVKKGDSLSVIAYKAGINISDLKEANGISGNKIFVNQKLIIPGGKSISDPVAMSVVTKKVVDTAIATDNTMNIEDTTTIIAEEPALDNGDVILAAPIKSIDNNSDFREYVVNEDDDDLYGVAMMWGVSVARLKEINKLSDTKLTVGQKLLIPVSE